MLGFRILVGQTMFEGNSFNPVLTGIDDFEIHRGAGLLRVGRSVDTMLGGVVRQIEALGHAVIPAVAAMARPGGPDLPIAVGLDLHGHITAKMAAHATIMTGYRTNPHSDMVETGARAALYLDRILRGDLRPRCVFTRLPYLTRGSDESTSEPLLSLNRLARERMSQPGVVDLSIFNILPFIDARDTGQVVLAYDQGEGAAIDAARAVSTALWEARDAFTETLPSVEDALRQAEEPGAIVVLGDNGDSVVSGTPGDSVEIDCAVGGAYSPNLSPLPGRWSVDYVGPSDFLNAGSYARGAANDLGQCAVLVEGALTVIVTERAPAVLDPAFYERVGVPLAGQRAVVAKSANHYKLSFAGIGRTITVDTPGLSAFRLEQVPFAKPPPIHPLDPVAWDFDSHTTVFPS